MINWTDAIASMMADVKKQIQDAELRATRFAMDAKNAKDRAALLEAQVKELTSSYQNACAVGDNLKEQMLKMVRQHEDAELAIEALKARLKRKNEQIQRLTEANAGYNKGIRRLRKRITELSGQNERLRRNCDSAAKEIFRLNELRRKYAWCFDEEDKV